MPPFKGVALNVTAVPGQNGFAEAAMVTPAGRVELTIMAMEFDVAGLPIGQEIFEFNSQNTTSPLLGK